MVRCFGGQGVGFEKRRRFVAVLDRNAVTCPEGVRHREEASNQTMRARVVVPLGGTSGETPGNAAGTAALSKVRACASHSRSLRMRFVSKPRHL